jgi:hypothetical protein
MATPKFITRRIVDGLPEKQSDAMHQIRYIPYPVVNLIFDKPVFNHGYDTWCPGNTFTDVIVADWVIQKQAGYQQKLNIISCYTPDEGSGSRIPAERIGARKIAANVLADFQKLMPGLNVDPSRGAHLPAGASSVYVDARAVHAGSAPGAASDGSRLLRQHGFGRSGIDHQRGNPRSQRAVKEVEGAFLSQHRHHRAR